jgi:CRISPR-associated endonuclease Csn1
VQLVINKLSGMPLRGGIAMNDSMIRVDVFRQADKFHLVPIYARQRSQKGLPNRAIVAYKDEEEWTLVDDKNFLFSLHPCDLICVKVKRELHFGYYAGCDRSTGAISIWVHDRNSTQGKEGLVRGIGIKTAIAVEKFNVDILGRIYLARAGRRHGLA